jgi:general secretion pathway protein K
MTAAMTPTATKNSETGSALIVVLLLITVLAVIILEFNYESQVELHLADNSCRAAHAFNCAEAGIAISMAALKHNRDILADEESHQLLSGGTQIPVGAGYCTISLSDESGKININTLKAPDGRLIRPRIDQLLRLIDLLNHQYGEHAPISYSLVPAIIDWVDLDHDVTRLSFVTTENTGAEDDYYQDLARPYRCKDARFDILSELLSVKGVTAEIFYGRLGGETRGVEPVEGIQQFLTIYGDGKVNINEASATVLQSLSERLSSTLAQDIVESRRFGPYQSIEELQKVRGMTPEVYEAIRGSITIQPKGRYYTVTATGVTDGFVRTIRVVLSVDGGAARVTPILRAES